MKRFLSVLLTVVLLVSGAVMLMLPAAAENDATDPVAPIFHGIQTKASETENKQTIRFVSVVPSLKGDVLGYKIKADYLENGNAKTKVVTYEGTDLESNVVYTALLGTESGYTEAYTAESIGSEHGVANPAGLFALCLNGVPTNIGEITFTVETYVKVGSTTITSDKTSFIMDNGLVSSKKVLYREDFNSISDGTYGTDVMNWTQNAVKVKTDDSDSRNKYLNLESSYYVTRIVDAEPFLNQDHYTVEADLYIGDSNVEKPWTALNGDGNYFNVALSEYDSAKHGSNIFGTSSNCCSTVFTIRRRYTFEWGDDWAKSEGSVSLTIRDGSGTDINGLPVTQSDLGGRDAIATEQWHHFAFEIDNTGEKTVMRIYIDGVKLGEYTRSTDQYTSTGLYVYAANATKNLMDNVKITTGAYKTNTD